MSIPGIPLTEDQRAMVNRLADGFLPLAAWLKTKHFKPSTPVPWRAGATLGAKSLGFDRFFEGLLIETSEDSDQKARWDWIRQDPLKISPIPNVGTWRASRGLGGTAYFSAALSDNALVDVEIREVSRADFYLPYWPLVTTTLRAADDHIVANSIAADDVKLTEELLRDASPFWPGGNQPKSSRFSRQFIKDILYCYLGLRNPVASPWSEAVLIELGEMRRLGNKFTRKDAADAVDTFTLVLGALTATKFVGHIAIPEREMFATPVGSPPVNARDLE